RIPRARHGGGVAHRGRRLPRVHRGRRQGQRLLRRGVLAGRHRQFVRSAVGTLRAVRTKGSMVGMCVALLLAAACSSGGGKAQPAPLVEKSSAIAAGDAICKQLAIDIPQMVTTYRSAHPAPTDADARDFLVNTLLPRIDAAEGA